MKLHFCAFLLSLTLIFTVSCENKVNLIDNLEEDILWAESTSEEIEEEDLRMIGEDIEIIQEEIDMDKRSFERNDLRRFQNLRGRYYALLADRGIENMGEFIEGLGESVDGFLQGLKKKYKEQK